MTPSTPASSRKPDYGLDAPGVQHGFLFGGAAGLIAGLSLIYLGHGRIPLWLAGLGYPAAWAGGWFFVIGCVMFWGSKIGKLRLRDKILSSIIWRGDEQVLDVGCGHGLMLIGAAKRLTEGSTIGVDIWSQRDQATNSAEATMENARREGVADRVALKSADARELPLPDSSFDVVLSSFAIHNIESAADRERAIREISRVLKPGGQLAIADIRHSEAYEKVLRSLGWTQVTRWFPNFLFVIPTRVLRATRP